MPMMQRTCRNLMMVSLVVGAMIVVASCGGGESTSPEATGAPSPDPTTTTAAVSTTESPTTEPVDSVPPATAETTTSVAAASTESDCLIGSWMITESELSRYFDVLADQTEGIAFTVVGGTGLEFTADRYEYRPAFTLELSMAGITGTGDTTGSVSGSYTARDGMIETLNDVNELEVMVVVGGQSIDASDLAEGFLSGAPLNESRYECTPDGPVIEFATSDLPVPIALVPA